MRASIRTSGRLTSAAPREDALRCINHAARSPDHDRLTARTALFAQGRRQAKLRHRQRPPATTRAQVRRGLDACTPRQVRGVFLGRPPSVTTVSRRVADAGRAVARVAPAFLSNPGPGGPGFFFARSRTSNVGRRSVASRWPSIAPPPSSGTASCEARESPAQRRRGFPSEASTRLRWPPAAASERSIHAGTACDSMRSR